MKKITFSALSQINKWILPTYRNRDISNLSKIDKVIIGYRYWVTKNYFDALKHP